MKKRYKVPSILIGGMSTMYLAFVGIPNVWITCLMRNVGGSQEEMEKAISQEDLEYRKEYLLGSKSYDWGKPARDITNFIYDFKK